MEEILSFNVIQEGCGRLTHVQPARTVEESLPSCECKIVTGQGGVVRPSAGTAGGLTGQGGGDSVIQRHER